MCSLLVSFFSEVFCPIWTLYCIFYLLFLFLKVLALVGDQLDYGDNICGAVLSIRFNEDILSVWNRNASDHQVCDYLMPKFETLLLIFLSLI